MQFAVLSWGALDARAWAGADQLPPPVLAHALATYADRVITPRSSTAVTGLELMTALRLPFLAAAARLTVGLGAPQHRTRPAFDKKLPGCLLVDLSGYEGDPRLPNPFTPHVGRPTGPAWYATPTIAYAEEIGAVLEPLEAWVRTETGAYLDPWHARLKTAFLESMADLGVPDDLADTDPAAFLTAMAEHKAVEPALAAIKSTVKGGLGKLRERSRQLQ